MRRAVAGARMPIDHRHDQAEFALVVRGSGSCILEDKAYALRPGTLIWLLPGRHHRLVRTTGLEMWVVMIRKELIDAAWVASLVDKPSHMLAGEELLDLDRLLSQVAQDSDEPVTYNAGIGYVTLRAWRASRHNPAGRERSMHPAVARALLILRDGDTTVSLTELARAAGIAAPYLSRLLTECTGRSFVEWRNRTRLDRFLRGYRPDTNFLIAATSAGFGSYARFHRVFTDVMGCTPSEWAEHADENPPVDVLDLPDDAGEDGGLPSGEAWSARQRWLPLVPLMAPAVSGLLGGGFLERVLDAIPVPGRGTQRPPAPTTEAMTAARARLVEELCVQDPDQAADLTRLTATVDFATTYAGVLEAYDFSATDICDGVTGLVLAIWVSANRVADPAPAQVQAAGRQVEDVLREVVSRLDADAVADAEAALQFHFVVAYHALQAVRAAGDTRNAGQLAAAARDFAARAFGGDITETDLSDRGLVRRVPPPASAPMDMPAIRAPAQTPLPAAKTAPIG